MKNDSTKQQQEAILIADHDAAVCDFICEVLEAEGHDCWPVQSAEHVLRLLEDRSFSLLICDVRLPGVSGIELLERVEREYGDRLGVVMVTAVDDPQTAMHALNIGAYGYLIKPFQATELSIQVASALERRRLVLKHIRHERQLEERVREQTEKLRASREEICMRLVAAQDRRHDETGEHVRRIGRYCGLIAREMGFNDEFVEAIRLTAPMHDVGKMAIPDRILQKPGALTTSEWDIMMTHTVHGWRILNNSRMDLLQLGAEIALTHHERWDGSGYPRCLVGEQIPRSGRIAAVADVYDALVSDRVYAQAKPLEEALEIMRAGRGEHFAPRVLDTFLEVVPELQRIEREVARAQNRLPSTEMQLESMEGDVSVRYAPNA